jgi:hypothetical protein
LLYHSSNIGTAANANKWTYLQPAGAPAVTGGFGPEISFGKQLSTLEPDRYIAIIKHADGGTDLALDWKPTAPYGPELNTFRSTVNSALSKITAVGHTYSIRGMFWQQGEADAAWGPGKLHPTAGNMSGNYAANLSDLVANIRTTFNVPDMPFIYGTVLPDEVGATPNDIPSRYPFRNAVRQAQMDADQSSGKASSIPSAYVVSTDTFKLHGDVVDGFRDDDFVHFGEQGVLDLGRAYADAIHFVHTVPEPCCSVLVLIFIFQTSLLRSPFLTRR